MTTSTKPKTLRQSLIGKVKLKAKAAGIDQGSDDYRQWLNGLTGKTSCADLTDDELSQLCDRLEGNTPSQAIGFPVASDRVSGQLPTVQQWKFLHKLAKEFGWEGLRDARMLQHVTHTTKRVALEDCNRKEVSDCIKGLERRMGIDSLVYNNRRAKERFYVNQ